MSQTNISIVVPNWNGKDLLGECLGSLQSQTLAAKIIVVDNGSTDGSAAFIHNEYPDVNVVELDKNYGFAGGVNRGISAALELGAEYIALFNNDAVAKADWLEQLHKRIIKSSKIAMVAAKMLRQDKKHFDSTGDLYSIWSLPFPRGRNEHDSGQYNTAEQVFAASGGASLYRAEMFKQIGLFDEAFFAYYEDVDLSFRARLKGWEIWYEPKAEVYHRVGATSNRLGDFAAYHCLKNMPMVYDKNMPSRLFWFFLPRKFIGLAATASWMISKGQILAVVRALWFSLVHAPAVLYQRRQIQRGRVLDATEIKKLLHYGAPPMSRTLTRLSAYFDRKYR